MIALLSLASAATGAQEESGDMSDPRTQEAIALMVSFAARTGLAPEGPRKRYLWTDAFAVCNFVGLAAVTGEEKYSALALELVDQVHQTLGRHRDGDPRNGWLSGLGDQEGESHPTRAGLRIGKQLPERRPDQPFDERLEWDRDGQYFHYLTKWMHALDQVARSTGRPDFNRWARELAETAQDAFVYQPSAASHPPRMYWKMSIDLKRPLVPSMGQHDPLDGYITYLQLHSTQAELDASAGGPNLKDEASRFAEMIQRGRWATADPLGLGGLLIDAYRVHQLIRLGALSDERLLDRLLTASLAGLKYYSRGGELEQPAKYRLAFRELGLAIGLHALQRLWQATDSDPRRSPASFDLRARLQALLQYTALGDAIETFWLDPEHRSTSTWSEHRDINEVMLATRLAPDGFLVLVSPQ
jgi:hypothetical protein